MKVYSIVCSNKNDRKIQFFILTPGISVIKALYTVIDEAINFQCVFFLMVSLDKPRNI